MENNALGRNEIFYNYPTGARARARARSCAEHNAAGRGHFPRLVGKYVERREGEGEEEEKEKNGREEKTRSVRPATLAGNFFFFFLFFFFS